MANRKYLSYLRVSTNRQGESGLGLEGQRTAVESYLSAGKRQLIEEIVEVESGKRNDRPALAHALELCYAYGATLIIAKLDRLARNVAFVSNLMESGVEFVAVDFPQANKLTIHILAAVAEHEAEAISQRTKAALAAAKARGTKLGGLRGDPSRMASIAKKASRASVLVRRANAVKNRTAQMAAVRSVRAHGAISYREIAAALNERGVRTTRGGQWSAVQVMRVVCDESATDERAV
jgi:DNA invertase Pin-like site-specific DNA recombinase